jgi:carboxymethylenebutenolidase
MHLLTETLEFPTGQTTALAFRARPKPAGAALPAVVLVQEVWGVDEHLRDQAARFATAGYLVLAPDLYSLGGRRPPAMAEGRILAAKRFLDTIPPSSWWDEPARNEALAALPRPEREPLVETFSLLLGPHDRQAQVAMLRDAAALVRADAGCTGKVGSVGFCNGGALSALLACTEPELDAAVVFYGASPASGAVAGLSCPVLGFYGAGDPHVTGTVPAFADAAHAAGKQFEWHVYDGAEHAFYNDTRRAYDVTAARHAWARTLTFLDGLLGDAREEHGATG